MFSIVSRLFQAFSILSREIFDGARTKINIWKSRLFNEVFISDLTFLYIYIYILCMYIRSEIEYDRVCCVGQREEGVSSFYRLDGALNWAQFAARSAEIESARHVCPASEILAQPGRLTGDHI